MIGRTGLGYVLLALVLLSQSVLNNLLAQQIGSGERALPKPLIFKTPNDSVPSLKKYIPSDIPWIVFSDRSDNPTYTSPSGKVQARTMNFMEAFYVIEVKEPFLHIVKYQDGSLQDLKKFTLKKGLEDYSWVHKSKLLLWDQPLMDEKGALPIKALTITKLNDFYYNNGIESNLKDSGKLRFFTTPELRKDVDYSAFRPIRVHQIVYIYKHDEETNRYLIGEVKFIAQPEFATRNVQGWVHEDVLQIWDHRLCLEPNWDPSSVRECRSNHVSANVFLDSNQALNYRKGEQYSKPIIANELNVERGDPQCQRLPVIKQNMRGGIIKTCFTTDFMHGTYPSEFVPLTCDTFMQKYDEAINRRRRINVIFVVNADSGMRQYLDAIDFGFKKSLGNFSGKKDNFRFGAVLYRSALDARCPCRRDSFYDHSYTLLPLMSADKMQATLDTLAKEARNCTEKDTILFKVIVKNPDEKNKSPKPNNLHLTKSNAVTKPVNLTANKLTASANPGSVSEDSIPRYIPSMQDSAPTLFFAIKSATDMLVSHEDETNYIVVAGAKGNDDQHPEFPISRLASQLAGTGSTLLAFQLQRPAGKLYGDYNKQLKTLLDSLAIATTADEKLVKVSPPSEFPGAYKFNYPAQSAIPGYFYYPASGKEFVPQQLEDSIGKLLQNLDEINTSLFARMQKRLDWHCQNKVALDNSMLGIFSKMELNENDRDKFIKYYIRDEYQYYLTGYTANVISNVQSLLYKKVLFLSNDEINPIEKFMENFSETDNKTLKERKTELFKRFDALIPVSIPEKERKAMALSDVVSYLSGLRSESGILKKFSLSDLVEKDSKIGEQDLKDIKALFSERYALLKAFRNNRYNSFEMHKELYYWIPLDYLP